MEAMVLVELVLGLRMCMAGLQDEGPAGDTGEDVGLF